MTFDSRSSTRVLPECAPAARPARPTLRAAREGDVPALVALVNGLAERNLLLPRTEQSVRDRLGDFVVAIDAGQVVGGAALTELQPGLGEIRSLAVRPDQQGRGTGRALVLHLLAQAGARGFTNVLALTRRVSFFTGLGFQVTERERFAAKLEADCHQCPLHACCDETALVRPAGPGGNPW